MEACNWLITIKLLVGFLEAQTNKYGEELDKIKYDLEQIAIDVLNCD